MIKMFCIVHLTSERKYVVHKTSKLDKAIEFIREQNEGATYLENETINKFLVDDELDDGLYIITDDDNDIIKVYRLETYISTGFLWSTPYKNRKLINEYELIDVKY